MAHDVFISYATEDQRVADAVCNALEEVGIQCWYAPRDIPYTGDYEEAIIDAISTSKMMVVILSSSSNNSPHVNREVQAALREEPQVPVLPFQVEKISLNKALRYYIGSVNWLSAINPPLETHLQKLVKYVRVRLSERRPEFEERERDHNATFEVSAVAPVPSGARRKWFDPVMVFHLATILVFLSAFSGLIGLLAPGYGMQIEQELDNTANFPKNRINKIGMEFVLVPSGSFKMGSANGGDDEKPVHQVTISKSFYMGKYEVKQAQWLAIIGNNPSEIKGDNLPVGNVSWDAAQDFLTEMTEKLKDGYTYRLPTEAEWEYAARAGTEGDYAGDLNSMAWYHRDGADDKGPVGDRAANTFGLVDMHGNVWEWCRDTYHSSYNSPQRPNNGDAWTTGGTPERVLRGGSWRSPAISCRSASRISSDRAKDDYGFRVVAVPNAR